MEHDILSRPSPLIEDALRRAKEAQEKGPHGAGRIYPNAHGIPPLGEVMQDAISRGGRGRWTDAEEIEKANAAAERKRRRDLYYGNFEMVEIPEAEFDFSEEDGR